MSGPNPTARRQGACLQCRKDKRKCDQKSPQCSQCLKKCQTCSLQVFIIKTINNSRYPAKRRKTERFAAVKAVGWVVARDSEATSALGYESPHPQLQPSPSEESESSASSQQQLCQTEYTEEPCNPIWNSPPRSNSHYQPLESDHTLGLTTGRSPSPSLLIVENGTGNDVADEISATADGLAFASIHQTSSSALINRLVPLQLGGISLQLPSSVLNSIVRRFLWEYFINRALQVFLCWEPEDTRLDRRYNDPYKDHIPAVVLGSRAMMLASLALSAFHFAGAGHGPQDDSLITSLMLEASGALAASRYQGPQMAGDFLSTIGTASFLYLLKPSRYADMLPLSQSAALCLMTDPKWQNIKKPSYQVIMQIFRWSNICAQCSLKRYVPIPDEYTQLCLELRENERATDLSPTYATWFVHPLYAFAEDMITPLNRVAWLIRLRQQGCIEAARGTSGPDAPGSPASRANSAATGASDAILISSSHFEDLVDEIEQKVQVASMRVLSTQNRASYHSTPPSAPDLQTELELLTTAIDSTVVLLFYTRIKDMPWTSSLVRFHVRNVVESLGGVSPSSRFTNGIVFPLFTSGLEAVDSHDRAVIIDKLKHLPGIWSHREAKLASCLNHVWELRDANPGLMWNSWVHQIPLDYEDLIPA